MQKEKPDHLLDTWQEAWEDEDGRASRTKELIKDQDWFLRKRDAVNYFFTKISGHGCFPAYLQRVKTSKIWEYARKSPVEKVGEVTKKNLIETLLENADCWQEINKLAKRILVLKEKRRKKVEVDK